jgi:hypothetical protein
LKTRQVKGHYTRKAQLTSEVKRERTPRMAVMIGATVTADR